MNIRLPHSPRHLAAPNLTSAPFSFDGPGGRVAGRGRVQALARGTSETLAARILKQEHHIYPQAVRWFVEGRLFIADGRVELTGSELPEAALLAPAG